MNRQIRKTPRLDGGRLVMTVLTIVAIHWQAVTVADDWRGWMGNERDGVLRESGLIESIPESGLPVLWRVPIAGGYAGPAVADGRVFVFDYEKQAGEAFNNPGQRANLSGRERLIVLDATTGDELWRHTYDCPYSVSYPAGPRCTPMIDGDHVYLLGSEGDLRCLSTEKGELIWTRSLKNDFSAEVPIWGFSAHPLIDGDSLITMVGGRGQGVVAFDKLTGETRWQALDVSAGYCPPSIVELGSTRQLIVYSPQGIDSLDPGSGATAWHVDISPMYDMSINRPMVSGDRMYASAIRTESVMLKLGTDSPSAEVLWRGEPKSALYTANSTPLFVGNVVYGTDCNEGSLIAMDAATGERLWTTFQATRPDEERFVKHGTAFITRVGETNRYFLFSEIGDLIVAELTPEAYREFGRFHVLEATGEAFGRDVVWSHPAYSNGVAYLRNDKEIVAVQIKQ